MPDPRHAAGSPAVALCMSYPLLMLVALWKRPGWRLVFIGCVLAALAAMLVMSGVAGVDRVRWAGLIQRPVALALLGPIALGAWALLRGRHGRL
jgi:hypothetical protein